MNNSVKPLLNIKYNVVIKQSKTDYAINILLEVDKIQDQY